MENPRTVVQRNPDKNFEVHLTLLSEEVEVPPLDINGRSAGDWLFLFCGQTLLPGRFLLDTPVTISYTLLVAYMLH